MVKTLILLLSLYNVLLKSSLKLLFYERFTIVSRTVFHEFINNNIINTTSEKKNIQQVRW